MSVVRWQRSREGYHVLYPAYGTYVGSAVSPWVPDAPWVLLAPREGTFWASQSRDARSGRQAAACRRLAGRLRRRRRTMHGRRRVLRTRHRRRNRPRLSAAFRRGCHRLMARPNKLRLWNGALTKLSRSSSTATAIFPLSIGTFETRLSSRVPRFELGTSWSQTRRANQTALRPATHGVAS